MRGRKRTVRERRTRESREAGKTLEVSIERILPGGAGLAHADGRTILIGLAAPGDRLLVKVESVRGRVAFASILEIIEPSPVRVEPPCPYFGRCGGCDFQQLAYDAQLAAKAEIIRDCLRRIARVEYLSEIPITASPAIWRYRSRAQWQYDARQARLGYYERGTHRVCDVAECPVIVEPLQAALSLLRERMREGTLAHAGEDFQAVAGDDGISLAPPLDTGETFEVSREIGAYTYRFSAEGFFQINHELLPQLVAAGINGLRGEGLAIDLYCGAGLFTLPLAQRYARVVGVEASAHAAAYARRNLVSAQLTNAQVECARVGQWLAAHAHSLAPVDLVLLDPPRAGAEEGAIGGILKLQPARISYVSCDPATLARDLKELIAGGYTLSSVAAFDMFPQTHHVETVAHLISQ